MRIYHGCPDTATKRQWDREQALRAQVEQLEPEAHLTYFPVQGKYCVAIWGTALSQYHNSPIEALQDALNYLQRRKENG